jgi:hypothetical protein
MTLPPLLVFHYILQTTVYTQLRMRKRRNTTRLLTQAQEETNKHNELIITPKEGNNNHLTIDQEIECPRCHDIMALYSDFDKLCYVCEECTLLLALN